MLALRLERRSPRASDQTAPKRKKARFPRETWPLRTARMYSRGPSCLPASRARRGAASDLDSGASWNGGDSEDGAERCQARILARPRAAKPIVTIGRLGRRLTSREEPVARARFGGAPPRSAARHAVCSLPWSGRIRHPRRVSLVSIGGVPIRRPLPDVAHGVIDTEGIRRKGAHRR